MSEKRRRRGGGSSGGDGDGLQLPKWAWAVGVVLVLLLAANLVFAFMGQTETGDPQGFVTPDLLLAVGFWTPLGLLVIASFYGLWSLEKAKERRELRGVGWLRGAFVFSLIGVCALGLATFETETFRRQEWIVLAMWVYGIQMLLFARMTGVQASSSEGSSSGRKRKSRSESGASGSADSARSAE